MDKLPLSTQPQWDYPAAHSMDTVWYAVDENGEIGKFESGENGYVPAPKGIPDEKLSTPESLAVDKDYTLNFKYHDPCRIDEPGYDHRDCDEENSDLLIGLPKHYHHYDAPDRGGYYYWISSPIRPANVRDLPRSVLDRVDLVFLKDYTFQSREPVNPFDYRPNCYGDRPCHYFPTYQLTSFPIPSRRDCWTHEDMADLNNENDDASYYFAVDDDDCVALFRADLFGAIPKAQWRARGRYNHDWGWDVWAEMTAGGVRSSAFPRPVARQFQPDSPDAEWPEDWAQREGWARHWLEYVFAPAMPRLFGLYHYDMSWLHAGPYARIAAPDVPARLSEFSPEWREKMNPARFNGVRFAAAEMIQPFEHVECMPGTMAQYELPIWDVMRCAQSEVWIDAALEKVHLCGENSIKTEDDDRLLRRARRYYEMVRSLSR